MMLTKLHLTNTAVCVCGLNVTPVGRTHRLILQTNWPKIQDQGFFLAITHCRSWDLSCYSLLRYCLKSNYDEINYSLLGWGCFANLTVKDAYHITTMFLV